MTTIAAPIDTAELASRLRLGVTRLARKLRQQAEPGITPSLLSALSTIERAGPMTIGDLCAAEQVQPPTMTRLVASLVETGLVERNVDPADRRVAWVRVTPAGREVPGPNPQAEGGLSGQAAPPARAGPSRRPGGGGRDPGRAGGRRIVTKIGFAVHRTFHSFSHSRNFRLFFVGQIVSVTGTWMQSVAAAWLVLQLTGSSVALGIQLALNFGPILLLGAWAGLLADRRDKRVILIGTQTAFALQALALWVLVFAGVAQLWMVYALSLFAGIVTAIDNPARQSFYAEMVGQKDLTNAVSLNSAVMTGTRIVGPALAGVLIATVGLAPSFLFNGISYVAVIAALIAMRPDELHREVVPVAREGPAPRGPGVRPADAEACCSR